MAKTVPLQKVLSITLGSILICAIGVLIYFITVPKAGEKFTEFYMLNPEGKATDYPREVVLGEKISIIVGIVNHEQEEVSYRVEIIMNGYKMGQTDTVILSAEEKWEEEVTLVPEMPGDKQRVALMLYKNTDLEPGAESLYFWLDVRG